MSNGSFEAVSDTVSSLLTRINNSIQNLQRRLETPDKMEFDGLMNLINTLILNFKQLNSDKNELLKFDDDDLNHGEVFAKEKLLVEINKSLKKFNQLQKDFTDFEKQANQEQQNKLNQGSSLVALEEESRGQPISLESPQEQQQFQIEYDPINSEELEYQQNLIDERNREIENISSSILEINDIYQDLNTMVQEQGLTIDSIENNIFSVLNDTKLSRNELVKLNNYQKRHNARCFWLLVILSVLFLLILLLVIV